MDLQCVAPCMIIYMEVQGDDHCRDCGLTFKGEMEMDMEGVSWK
jgi:hypothetical protein